MTSRRSAASWRRLRVFLCHGKEDKDAVRALRRHLKEAGMQPWLDEEDILPGQLWEPAVLAAVQRSHVLLACLSATSVGRRGFIQREIEIALDKAQELPETGVFIIPLRLDDCIVPGRLAPFQWFDLRGPADAARLVARLKQLVRSGSIDLVARR
jgi:hypothetical protein